MDLPGIDGCQVAQLIRHGETAGRQVAIVAMSTHRDEDEIARARQAGIDALLHKPLSGAQLAQALREALATRPAVRRTRHNA